MRSFAQRRRQSMAAMVIVLAPSLGIAAEIRIEGGDCASGVHLVARDARFRDVLERLAEKLDFQLRFEGSADPIVNVDITRPSGELVARISPADSVIVTEARDPKCNGQKRVVKVWVLPTGDRNASVPARPSTPAAAPPLDEAARTILRGHGMIPPPNAPGTPAVSP